MSEMDPEKKVEASENKPDASGEKKELQTDCIPATPYSQGLFAFCSNVYHHVMHR